MQKWMTLEHVGCTQYTMPFNMVKRPQSGISRNFLLSMFKIFHEFPSRRADFENETVCGKNDCPLQFCAHRWIENEVVLRRAQVVWLKLVKVVRYWQSLPKSKQPGQGKTDSNKSYQRLPSSCSDALVHLNLAFFEEVAKKLNKFLLRFQANSPTHPLTFPC